jgi:tetratricopeptide (TPR) repeat protein
MRYEAIRSLAVTAAAVSLLLASGCAAHHEFGMESPGRPEVTWHTEPSEPAAASQAPPPQDLEPQLLADLHAAEQKSGDDLALADALYRLGILRRQQGKFAEAEQLYRRALEIREHKLGPNDLEVASTLNNLAAVEALQGKYDEARPLLERALDVRRTVLGSDNVLTAESLNNLALLYAAQGNTTEAEPLYQQALAVLDKANGDHDPALERILDNYAALLRDTGRDDEAAHLDTRARLLRAAKKEPLGPSP